MNDPEFKIEWLFVSLRWFFLLSVAGVIGIDTLLNDQQFPAIVLTLLAIGSVANMMTLIALLQNALGKPMRILMLIHDTMLTLGFVATAGNAQSTLLFVAIIPISTAAMRFSWLTSLSVIFSVVITYWAIAWQQAGLSLQAPPLDTFLLAFPYLTNGLTLLLAGGAVAQISIRQKQTLLAEREKREQQASTALKIAHQKSRLVFELTSTLSATLNYERVLEAALDVSNKGLKEFFSADPERDVSQVGLILLFGMDQSLYIAKARGISTQDEHKRFPGQHGILATAIEKAEPVLSADPGADPELSQISAMHFCHQAIVVPLRAGYEGYGLLVLGNPEPDTYTPDFQDLLIAVSNQAVMALQNASLYQNLIAEKERLVAVEEDARKKLARDLHDGPTQTIAAIAMRLNYIRMLIPRDPAKSLVELEQLENLARNTTKEIRQMLFTLRPLILETQGLIAALAQLKQKINETNPQVIHLKLDKDAEVRLSKAAQGALFYIVEEATTNARKHAQANNLWWRLYNRASNVIVEIQDDGKGFEVAKIEENYASRGSLGMRNLYERAELVKGKTVIKSTPGKGTTISITIPIQTSRPESTDL